MKSYYILADEKRSGPFSVFELKEKGIYKDTQVWDSEAQYWFNAEEFPELRHIIIAKEYGDEYVSDFSQDENIKNSGDAKFPPPVNAGEGYYIMINQKSIGPFSIYELKERKTYNDTRVWNTELNVWMNAEEFPALRHILIKRTSGEKIETKIIDDAKEDIIEQENKTDENEKEYYVLVEGKKAGPFTLDDLKEKSIFTYNEIWSDEHDEWIRADEFPELRHLLIRGEDTDEDEVSDFKKRERSLTVSGDENQKGYYILIEGKKRGPYTIYDLKEKNIFTYNEIWSDEHDDWIRAEEFPELRHILIEGEDMGDGPYFGYHIASRGARLIGYIASIVCQAFVYGAFFLVGYLVAISSLSTAGIIFFLICIYGGMIVSYIVIYPRYPKYCGNLGHKLMGLKVISSETGEDYNKLSQGIFREVLKLMFGYVLIPCIWLLWDKDNQNLYDKITNTYVVKKKV